MCEPSSFGPQTGAIYLGTKNNITDSIKANFSNMFFFHFKIFLSVSKLFLIASSTMFFIIS